MSVVKCNSMLATYPDEIFAADFILRGIKNGFKIGFAYNSVHLKDRYQNLMSAMDHPKVVQAYLDKEMELKGVIEVRSLKNALYQDIHCSLFGVIPRSTGQMLGV